MNVSASVDAFVFLGITLFAAFLLKIFVSERLRFPAVTLYVALGVVLGISALRIFQEESLATLGFISRLGIGLIAFIIGAELDSRTMKQLGRPIILIGILESLLAFVLVNAAVLLFFPGRWHYALILGAVSSATAPAATVYVIRQYKTKGPLTSTIMGVVGFDDAVALIIFVFASLFTESILGGTTVNVAAMIYRPLLTIVSSVAVGVGLGVGYYFLLRRLRDPESLLMAAFSAILLLLGVSEVLGLSDLLTIMSFAVFLTNTNLMLANRTKSVLENLSPVLLPFFFILAGARLDVRLIGKIGLLGLAYTAARMTGKVTGGTLGAVISRAPPVVRRFIGFSLFPQVGVAIALALTVQNRFDVPRYGAEGKALSDLVINILLFTTLITEVVGPFLTRATLTAAGETYKGA
jgi:Kef-type K+ transport system membrane component KefB